MPLLAGLGLVLGVSISPCDLKQVETISTRDRSITVSDVLTLSCLAPERSDAIAAMVIAQLPSADARHQLSRGAVKSLVHRRVPGINFTPSSSDNEMMTFVASAPQQATKVPMCTRAKRDLPAGRAIAASDLEDTPCEDHIVLQSVITFDRASGVPRTRHLVLAGESLGRLRAPNGVFNKGDLLSLSVGIGAVRIERDVTAVQTSTAGERLFVRDGLGAIISVPTLATPETQKAQQ